MDVLPDQKEYDCIQNGDFCSHWLLFGLVSVILGVIVSISISVFTKVSGLSFRLELVDIVNHCWIEKNLRLLLFFILYAEEFMVTEMILWSQKKKQCYFDFL